MPVEARDWAVLVGIQHYGNDLGPLNGPDNGCSTTCEVLATACGTQEAEAELVAKPVDIIITIDNSGSMGEEIAGVQSNINVNFAQIIEASGLDYRVIMVSRFGNDSGEDVCIEAPLSGIPQGGCEPPPDGRLARTHHADQHDAAVDLRNGFRLWIDSVAHQGHQSGSPSIRATGR